MDNQEAIDVMFNEWKCIDRNDGINCDRKCESCDLVMDVQTIREAFNMAISALQAQDVPDINVGNCPYCHEDSDGYVTPLEKNCHAFVRRSPIDGWVLSVKYGAWRKDIPIRFCPMCGRRLKHG